MSFIFTIIHALWKASWFLITTLVISLSLYFIFYMTYLPQATHVKKVHLHYSSKCQQNIGDGYCTFPTAMVMLHDSSKAAKDGLRVLTRGQNYDISLELEVPTSEQNKGVGVFMVQLDLLSKDGKLIESSLRSAMVHYESGLVSTIFTWVYIIPLLTGFKDQKHHLSVLMLENYVDDSYNPATTAIVTLHSKYLQWYSTELKVSAVFTGIRYYMHNWPITFSLLAFMTVFSLVTLWSLWRAFNVPPGKSAYSDYGNVSESSDDENVENIQPVPGEASTARNRNVLRIQRRTSGERSESNNS